MIPKKIHYCWFGENKLPRKAKKCIDSWRKYCPDYEIIEWNEENFDINTNEYTKMCYEQKKYAFLTDYIRLFVVAKYGGIYFDTDVEVIRSFDDMLNNSGFLGFENDFNINTGLGFGAEKGNIIICKMLEEYDILLDGKHGVIGCPILNTKTLENLGLEKNGKMQVIDDVVVYPKDYFNPYDDSVGKLNVTKNSYSIHWFAKTWMSKRKVLRSILSKPLHRVLNEIRK